MRIKIIALLFCAVLLLPACTHVHDYGDWVTEREATCQEIGESYRVCYTCGEKQVQVLPVCHEYIEGVCRLCGYGSVAVPATTVSVADSTVPHTTTGPTDNHGGGPTSTHSTTSTTSTTSTDAGTNFASSRWETTASHSTAPQGWTVYKMQAVVDTLFTAARTATTISTDLAGVCNSPDSARILNTIDSARRQMQSVRQTIALARQQLLQEEPVPSIDPAYSTAADHAQAVLALCDRIMAAPATADTAATVAWEMLGDLHDLLNACVAMQQSVQGISLAE